LAGSGEASVSTNNLTNSSALEELDAREGFVSVNGNSGPEPNLRSHVATFLGEQLQAFHAYLMAEPVPDRFVLVHQELNDPRNREHLLLSRTKPAVERDRSPSAHRSTRRAAVQSLH
jgi:hypothetical protein